MKRHWKKIAVPAIAAACLLGGFVLAQDTPEKKAIKEAFIGSQNTAQCVGMFESTNGKTNTLSDEQIQMYIDAFNADMDRYYSSDNICREQYKQTNEQLLRDICTKQVAYLVDGGVLSCDFHSISVSEDGNSATVNVTIQTWGNWVEENETGAMEVVAPIGQDKMVVTMVKEEGLWKLESIEEMQTEFGMDLISEQQQETSATSLDEEAREDGAALDEYVEETTGSEYSTFEEALAVAESIDPDTVNPFTVLADEFTK